MLLINKYWYHHKVLSLLSLKYIEWCTTKNNRLYKILPYTYNNHMVANEFSISEETASYILNSLKVYGCLHSRYMNGSVYYWVTDEGRLKCGEMFFKYKKRDINSIIITNILKFMFYVVSTIGIIYSIHTKSTVENMSTKQDPYNDTIINTQFEKDIGFYFKTKN